MHTQVINPENQNPFYFFAADDGVSIRYGFWPGRQEGKAGTIILLNGRRDFMEKYDEITAELNQRDFNVYSMDWRGQGGSQRLLLNRHKGFIDSYDSYLNDLNCLVQHILTPRTVSPLIVLAHSMGAHVALRYLHDRPGIVDRAIFVSPLIDITDSIIPRRILRFLTRLVVGMGMAKTYTLGSFDYSPADGHYTNNNRRTSDRKRFNIEPQAIAENPDLALGGVTYGWLDAMFSSTEPLTKSGFVDEIRTPILIISAGADRVVSNKAQHAICAKIPDCTLKTIPGARHEILAETDSILSMFWKEFDEFSRC